MADDTILLEKKGMRPSVQSSGGNMVIDWQSDRPTSTVARIAKNLGSFLDQQRQAEQQRAEKLKKQFDMYKVLRDSGYDAKSAYDAVIKNQMPDTPGEESLEEKEKLASIEEKKAKASYYRAGGSRKKVIDKMTPNQLQQRLKYLSDSYSNDPDVKSEIDYINSKLKTVSGFMDEPVVMTGPDGRKYKIPRKNAEKAKARGFK